MGLFPGQNPGLSEELPPVMHKRPQCNFEQHILYQFPA
jgi:hypothetical protein